MNKIKFLLLLLLFILIYSCASEPDTPPVEEEIIQEPVQEEIQETETEEIIEVEPEPVTPEPEPEPEPEPVIEESPIVETVEEEIYIPEPFNESLLKEAKQLIFKAEEARAKSYFPSRLSSLKNLLNKINLNKENDPDLARELYNEFETMANSLIEDSWNALKQACIKILNDQTKQLLKLKANKYTPEEYQLSQQQKEEAFEAFKTNNFSLSIANYRTAYTSMTNLYNTLADNMGYISNLLRLLKNLKAEGEALEVGKWALKEYQVAVDSYEVAKKLLYKDYDAVAGEKALRDTVYYARKAIKQTRVNIEVAKTDEEILNLLNELEEASTLTILDQEDNIINPEVWEGEADLIEKPIEADVEKDEESGLQEIDLEKDVDVDYPDVSYKIDETTKVLGIAEIRKSLLDEAKSLWALGVEARNNGDLEKAHEYLSKAKVYLDEYKSMAVDYIYTVQLIPERRDCLWRIAEKDQFYADPFLWPHIWERNKRLIQDPDLIYPGWQLIIPPLD